MFPKVVGVLLLLSVSFALHPECVPKCARSRFPDGLNSNCGGVRGLVNAWYADKMDEMHVNYGGYKVPSDSFVCASESILQGDAFIPWNPLPSLDTGNCSYRGTDRILANNPGDPSGVSLELIDATLQFNRTKPLSEISWINPDDPPQYATCVTFYLKNQTAWSTFRNGLYLGTGITYCSPSDFSSYGCNTQHANLFAYLYGRCPSEGDNLVMSGGSVCGTVYSGHSNTFNNGDMAWNDGDYYLGTNMNQNPTEFSLILSKVEQNNRNAYGPPPSNQRYT